MLHPLATASASSANLSTKAMSSAIPLVRTAAFHCSKHTGPSCFREPPTKILRKCEHRSDGRVTLDKMLQIGCLLSRAALCGSHHHKCNTSRRRRLVPDNGLFRDRARSSGTKGAQPHLKCTLRSRVSLSDNFLVQPGYVMAPLVPSRNQVGKVRINDGRRARSSSQRWRRFLFESTVDTGRADSDEPSQSALCDILLDTVSRSAYEDSLVGGDEHGALARLFPAPLPSLQNVPFLCYPRSPC